MIGKQLKLLRKHYNLSQQEIAVQVDVSTNTWNNYETDKRSPSEEFLNKLLIIYPNVNGHWILTGKGSMFLENLYNGGQKINNADLLSINLKEWGNRLYDWAKKKNYSDEKMANLLGIKLERLYEIIKKSPFPTEKEAINIKGNFNILIDDLLFDENNDFIKKLSDELTKEETPLNNLINLTPNEIEKLKNLLRGS